MDEALDPIRRKGDETDGKLGGLNRCDSMMHGASGAPIHYQPANHTCSSGSSAVPGLNRPALQRPQQPPQGRRTTAQALQGAASSRATSDSPSTALQTTPESHLILP
ncbi:hypothetical protein TgHK011_000488 [Trichoderma gracile]|nr:hypothetical protein TgHK011_000488 [Trichoderma gracile]